MELPTDIHEQIAAKAQQMNLAFDETVALLLRYGLERQNEREALIEDLANRLRRSTSRRVKDRLSDELGGMIFGQ
jgi:transcription elongation GreA/GreB family factor